MFPNRGPPVAPANWVSCPPPSDNTPPSSPSWRSQINHANNDTHTIKQPNCAQISRAHCASDDDTSHTHSLSLSTGLECAQAHACNRRTRAIVKIQLANKRMHAKLEYIFSQKLFITTPHGSHARTYADARRNAHARTACALNVYSRPSARCQRTHAVAHKFRSLAGADVCISRN